MATYSRRADLRRCCVAQGLRAPGKPSDLGRVRRRSATSSTRCRSSSSRTRSPRARDLQRRSATRQAVVARSRAADRSQPTADRAARHRARAIWQYRADTQYDSAQDIVSLIPPLSYRVSRTITRHSARHRTGRCRMQRRWHSNRRQLDYTGVLLGLTTHTSRRHRGVPRSGLHEASRPRLTSFTCQ